MQAHGIGPEPLRDNDTLDCSLLAQRSRIDFPQHRPQWCRSLEPGGTLIGYEQLCGPEPSYPLFGRGPCKWRQRADSEGSMSRANGIRPYEPWNLSSSVLEHRRSIFARLLGEREDQEVENVIIGVEGRASNARHRSLQHKLAPACTDATLLPRLGGFSLVRSEKRLLAGPQTSHTITVHQHRILLVESRSRRK